jgi:hypothetical protein
MVLPSWGGTWRMEHGHGQAPKQLFQKTIYQLCRNHHYVYCLNNSSNWNKDAAKGHNHDSEKLMQLYYPDK